jgi:hypothetical protein
MFQPKDFAEAKAPLTSFVIDAAKKCYPYAMQALATELLDNKGHEKLVDSVDVEQSLKKIRKNEGEIMQWFARPASSFWEKKNPSKAEMVLAANNEKQLAQLEGLLQQSTLAQEKLNNDKDLINKYLSVVKGGKISNAQLNFFCQNSSKFVEELFAKRWWGLGKKRIECLSDVQLVNLLLDPAFEKSPYANDKIFLQRGLFIGSPAFECVKTCIQENSDTALKNSMAQVLVLINLAIKSSSVPLIISTAVSPSVPTTNALPTSDVFTGIYNNKRKSKTADGNIATVPIGGEASKAAAADVTNSQPAPRCA